MLQKFTEESSGGALCMYLMVQAQIGYEFKNRDLLRQAFVRRSYSKENGGPDNEVLEFVGDKVLDIAVIRYLANRFGHVSDGEEKTREFTSDYTEAELTQMKACMVTKNSLACRIDELGFAQFLIMGKGDIQNHVAEEVSVKEDLFEAIIGAVAIDSGWDFEKLQSVVEVMLDPDSYLDSEEENYVQLIQNWEQEKNGTIPCFRYYDRSCQANWCMPFDGVKQNVNDLRNTHLLTHTCEMKLLDRLPVFQAYGRSKNEARKNVCRLAYEWLDEHNELFTIQDEIENPNKDDAINQLEILARRGYFSVPTYEFREEHDGGGNPVWTAECHIEEEESFCNAVSTSKKDAKKQAAFDMLKHILHGKEAGK